MGLKGKIKGSYLYTQWKLGKYTKRRVKHSNYSYNNYDDDDMGSGYNSYPVSSSNSYSYPDRNTYSYSQNSSYNHSYSNDDYNGNNYYSTYNRMAYYPSMDENSRQEY